MKNLKRGLVVHGNYLSEDEVEFIAGHPNLTVVYCPRTHAFFGHRDHPWQELLEKGASVAVGTDSRASNPDLNLWRELLFLRKHFPEVDPRTLLSLGTTHGARALGISEEAGCLQLGRSADLTVIRLPESHHSEAYSSLFDSNTNVLATMRAGRWITPALQ